MNNSRLQIILFVFAYFGRAESDTSTVPSAVPMTSTLIFSTTSSVIPPGSVSSATPAPTTPNASSGPTSVSSISTVSGGTTVLSTSVSYATATASISNTSLQSTGTGTVVSTSLSYATATATIANTSLQSTGTGTVVSTSISYATATATIPNTSLQSTGTGTVVSTSIVSHATGNFSSIASPTIIQSTQTSSIIPNTSLGNSSFFYITTQPSISPTNTSISLKFKYIVASPVPLKIGNIIDQTALQSVQNMVSSSFNLSNTSINVTRAEIRVTAKANNNQYDMITDILFSSSRTNCNVSCIQSSSSTPTQNLTLPGENGSPVQATAKAPTLFSETIITTTNAPVNYQNGESPPGVAAQLGMGFGITIISVLIIGEVIFLYRKYGLTSTARETHYELPAYHNRPSI